MVRNKFDDFIFDNLYGDAIGYETTYNYTEVNKAMIYAYNLALDKAVENNNNTLVFDINKSEWISKDSIIALKIVE